MNEGSAISEPGKDTPCFRERCGIDIEPEKPAMWRGAVEDGLAVASPTDRAIEEAASFAGIKLGEYLGQKDRLMKPPIPRPRDP